MQFDPPRWLRSPHLQSVGASLGLRRHWLNLRRAPVLRATRIELLHAADTWFSVHASLRTDRPRKLVVLLHGWEGSSQSNYLVASGHTLFQAGYDVVRLNLRDHGNTHALNRGIFHSCRIDEVVAAVAEIARQHQPGELYLAGFSLGGNFALRVALRAAELPQPLAKVVAVCPVIVPKNALLCMEQGPEFYRRYFVRKWQRSLARKQALWPRDYDFSAELRMSSLAEMTQALVERYTEFATLDDYLDGYSVGAGRLLNLAAPTTIISASDDPVIPISDLADIPQSEHLNVIATPFGGHCGYFDRFSVHSWAENAMLHLFGAHSKRD